MEQYLSTNRIKGDIPTIIELGGEEIEIPSTLQKNLSTVSLDSKNAVVRSTFISPVLGSIFNSSRFEDPDIKFAELNKALKLLDELISNFVKESILKRSHNLGFSAFAQSHENVGIDEVMISSESFKELVRYNSNWSKCRKVVVVRYPNLGPQTTIELNLVVQQSNRPGGEIKSKLGCVWLNQAVLKNCLEGDADGDMIFCSFSKKGTPLIQDVPLERSQGSITDSDIKLLTKKSLVNKDLNEAEYLAAQIDHVPIDKATYIIRWLLYLKSLQYTNEYQPLNKAWEDIAPEAIKLVEFVMDIRKGDFSKEEIKQKLEYIDKVYLNIQIQKSKGHWFAKTVTSGKIQDIEKFLETFPTSQSYLDYCQRIE